jgi:hypothetical protein
MYEEIQIIQKQKIYSSPNNMVKELSLPRNNHIFHIQYLKNIPYIVIALAIIITVFSLLLFFFDLRAANTYTSPQETKRKELKIIPKYPKKAGNLNSF